MTAIMKIITSSTMTDIKELDISKLLLPLSKQSIQDYPG